MKKNTHQNRPQPQDDDLWTWVVIGLIIGTVTLVLYGPFVWQATHG